MDKKTFRLEDGTLVTADSEICKAYESKLNSERYQERKQRKYATVSLDDERAANVFKSDTDTEQEAEKNINYEMLHEAIGSLSEREQEIIHDYYFEGLPLRQLAKKYGVSHTTLNKEKKTALEKIREYIIDKNS